MAAISIHWHRRDLRLFDNAALSHALQGGLQVLPLFIFDTDILNHLEDPDDARVTFIHREVCRLRDELRGHGSAILVKFGRPAEVWAEILKEYEVAAVYTNDDYEPYAAKRDAEIAALLGQSGIPFHRFKDHVIFERQEVVKADGAPYVVFTPYSRAWKACLMNSVLDTTTESGEPLTSCPAAFAPHLCTPFVEKFLKTPQLPVPDLSEMGFTPSSIPIPPKEVAQGLIRTYGETRNFPSVEGTSRLGIHFRFGTISIREKARKSIHLSETFLNELIWRDFYAMILANFPRVAEGPFREQYAAIPWRDDEEAFQAWCEGRTGYPIVDAGMRQLNQTGYMHNRVRMITASFLTKHLLLDWRLGEAWFARKLLDFDLASNNGGWQWAAGCGTDAAPYFRIFNPTSQQEKFDKHKAYIKQWVPEFGTSQYPPPIVDHKFARERCLSTYKAALAS